MVATSIMSTDAEMNAMAGEDVDGTGWIDANKTAWGLHAECFINCLTRKNFSDKFGTLNIDVKYILSEYVARYVGMCGIMYNMTLMTLHTRIEAEDRVNVHWARMKAIEKLLSDPATVTYMWGA